MNKYLSQAQAAKISDGKQIKVSAKDPDFLKDQKELLYFELDFTDVKNVDIQSMGIYAKDKDAAIQQAAEMLKTARAKVKAPDAV